MLQRWLLVGILAIACAAYWTGLQGPLLFDDVQNLAPLNAWLQGRLGWESVVFGNTSGRFGRPVAMASFVLNVALMGEAIWSLKLVNLVLHLLNGVLVYTLLSGINARTDIRHGSPGRSLVPLLATAIWVLHPLLVSTVLYVVQRMAMLSATFSLLAMLAYLHGRIALDQHKLGRAWTLLALVPFATVFAALSKENGILAFALCGVIEWFVFQPPSASGRNPWSRAWIGLTLLAPAVIATLLTLTQSRYIVGGYGNRPFTLTDRLLTQPRVLWDYVASIVLPYGPRLGLYHDDYPISHGLFQPPATALAIVGWLTVVALGWRWRQKIPGFALGVGIFLVGHALESTVFPLLMYFEHRNYLPAIGAIWAVLSLILFGAAKIRSHMHHPNAILTTAGTALVITLALATGARTAIWSSLPSLLTQDLANHPNSPWLRIAAAGWALNQQPPRPDLARQHLDHLVGSADRDTQRIGAAAHLIVDCANGAGANPDLVATTFNGYPLTMESDLLTTYEKLGDVTLKHPCTGLSTRQFATMLTSMLDRMKLPRSHYMMRRLRYKAARMYLESGRIDEALVQAKLAHDNLPVIAPMTALLAEMQLRKGNRIEAGRLIEVAAAKIPADDRTGRNVIAALRTSLRNGDLHSE